MVEALCMNSETWSLEVDIMRGEDITVVVDIMVVDIMVVVIIDEMLVEECITGDF